MSPQSLFLHHTMCKATGHIVRFSNRNMGLFDHLDNTKTVYKRNSPMTMYWIMEKSLARRAQVLEIRIEKEETHALCRINVDYNARLFVGPDYSEVFAKKY
jgi:hypothetical protein